MPPYRLRRPRVGQTDRLIKHFQMTTDFMQQQITPAEIVLLGDFNATHILRYRWA